MATLQIIGKGYTFHQKPEDILADNNYVDFLSPRDVRMLTYLGYLEINQPEYKLLAKRLLEDNQEIFVIKKKGKKATFTQTTEEIHKNSEIIKKLNAEDAHTVGYALASKESLDELNAKKAAKNILGDKK